jgi:hypothetical protein
VLLFAAQLPLLLLLLLALLPLFLSQQLLLAQLPLSHEALGKFGHAKVARRPIISRIIRQQPPKK